MAFNQSSFVILIWIALLLLCLSESTLTTQTMSANGTYIAVHGLVVTFYEAERFCQSTFGTHLASIHNEQQAEEIHDLITSALGCCISYGWIGLTDEILDGHMIWTDGTPFDYSRDPITSNYDKHCWRLRYNSYEWTNTECGFDAGYMYMVCNAHAEWTQTTDYSFLPPVKSIGTSLDGAYTLYNHSATFVEADAYCQRMLGTHLASVTNHDQAEMIQELCSRTESDSLCWIGLTELFSNGYEWSDGSDIGFYRWMNNADLSYSCAAITSNDGSSIYSWTTNGCYTESTQTVFICSTYPPTPYPTEIPSESPVTTNPTAQPSTAPTVSPYTMLQVDGSYLCSELADRVAIEYEISYAECMDTCRYQYGDICAMVNYRADTIPSRCYIFDTQCTLAADNTGDSRVTFMESKDECADLDWNDINGDACYAYSGVLGFCANSNVTDAISESEIKALGTNINGMDACCACGGGTQMIDGVTMTFEAITSNDNDLLCKWPYGNPSEYETYATWDNIMLYKLCQILKDATNNEVDCNAFIDSSYSGDINFISCDFDDFSQSNHDLYFVYIISYDVVAPSIDMYFNPDWFQLAPSLLPKVIQPSTYTQCRSSLWTTTNHNVYTALTAAPCDTDRYISTQTTSTMPSSTPSSAPTPAPTTAITASTTTRVTVISTVAKPTEITDIKRHEPTDDAYNNPATSLFDDDDDDDDDDNVDNEFDTELDDRETLEMMGVAMTILSIALVILIAAFFVFICVYCKSIRRKDGYDYRPPPQSVRDTHRLNVEITNLDNIAQGNTPSTDESKALAKDWKKLYTDDGKVYYQNDVTKQTQWEYPITHS